MNSNPRPKSIAIVGASGAVGSEVIRTLAEREFPTSHLKLLGSARSAGRSMEFRGEAVQIEELGAESFKGIDLAFFTASGKVSRDYVPIATAAGVVSVDNSSAFRLEAGVPLVIPEVNPQDAQKHRGVIANPNCSTIIAAVPLWPLHKAARIRRLIVSTYQASSGAGAEGMRELVEETRAKLADQTYERKVFPHEYAFNLFSHNSPINPLTLYNQEEEKLLHETRKIFGAPDLRIAATCVRVPILRAHSESITVEFERPVTVEEARQIFSTAPGVTLVDDFERNHFPMPSEASGQGNILVGRIRHDTSDPSGHSLTFFVAGDQLLKGAALNAVQIAELL